MNPPGSSPTASTDAVRTFVIADMAGFTALTESHGDHTAADFATRLEQVALDALDHDDALVKCLGDAVLLAAPDAKAGLQLAVRVVRAAADEPNFPLLRVGLHHGPAVRRGDDWFGAAVNLTARVAAEAAAGELVVTDAVVDSAIGLDLAVHDRGTLSFKNVRDAVRVWEIRLDPGQRPRPVDPTCHMTVSPLHAKGWLEHGDDTYYFCSEDCLAQFVLRHGNGPRPKG